jgi:tetratricopeptide (TPR) repeat protein/glycosyltransferase involved in cell wall biosynthesis
MRKFSRRVSGSPAARARHHRAPPLFATAKGGERGRIMPPPAEDAVASARQHHAAGRLDEADALYQEVLRSAPRHVGALHALGVIAAQRNRPDQAEEWIRRELAVAPDHAEACNNLGGVLAAQGRSAEALACFERALARSPDFADAHFNRALALHTLGRHDAAVAGYERVIALQPERIDAHLKLGDALRLLGRLDAATTCFERAAALNPDRPDVPFNIGLIHQSCDRLAEAETCYRRAIALKPDYAAAYNNLGNVLHSLGRLEEARDSHQRALAIDPDYVVSLNNLALVWQGLGRSEEAVRCFEQAIALKPDYAGAHWNLSLTLLTTGDFPRGAAEYEWRWQTETVKSLPQIAVPAWEGQPLPGEALLIRTEQGFGDAIQFIRYAPLLRQRCGRLVVQCPEQLRRLFGTVEGIDEIVAKDEAPPPVAAHAPLLSMLRLLGTTVETIPARVPYLGVDPARVEAFRERIGAAAELKVGLAWAGSPLHQNNRNRSLKLPALAPLFGEQRVRFFSLQKGEPAEELGAPGLAGRLVDLAPHLGDFADTAAAISCLDLVICVDTAVAHLAGALAKPVWTLVTFTPDWRWLLDRDDSPWYPTMRLYRQSATGDWEGVIARVAADLSGLAERRARASGGATQEVPGRALFAEALRRRQAGRTAEAQRLLQQVVAAKPAHPRAHYYLGIEAGRRGAYEAAEGFFRRAVDSAPNYAEAHYNLGNALAEQGRLDDAVASYRRAALLEPRAAAVHLQLAETLRKCGRLDEAAASYRRAVAIKPSDAAAHFSLGLVLQEQRQFEPAAQSYRRAVECDPGYAPAYNNLGVACTSQGALAEAIASFEQALRLKPDSPDTLANLGTALAKRNETGKAVECLRRAVALRPDFAGALVSLGNVLRERGEVDAALGCLRRAIALEPNSSGAYNNLGAALQAQNRLDEALESYERAIALSPDNERAHFNLGMARLLNGEFAPGTRHYERRARVEDFDRLPPLPVPEWDGTPLPGQTLLLRTEQGYGDAIQFIRYAPLVRQRCGRLVVACFDGVARLFATAPGIDEILTAQHPLPPIAAHLPLLSAMHVLGTDLQTIPAAVPYLGVDPERRAAFEQRIGAAPGLRVGLVWAGSPDHKNDHHRSLRLAALAPLWDVAGARFFSLQKGAPAAEIAAGGRAGRIVDLGPDLADFADTAAAVACLDLVIAVDTAVAHLAGALAKPVWTMIPFAPDWRWLLGRDDSPWYPTMRLYRQPAIGDWASVIRRVAADLSRLAERHARAAPGRPAPAAAIGGDLAEAVRHHRAGRTEQAEILFRRVLAGDPGHSQALCYLGIAAGRREAYEEAAQLFRRALAAAPDYADAHYNLGGALQAQGRVEEAIASYQEAARLRPDAAAVHHALADALHRLGRLDAAAASYRRTIALKPDDADAHLNLGNVLDAQGKRDEAVASFRRVLAVAPGHAGAHYNIANALKAQDRLEEAVASYRRALEAQPDYFQACNNLGNALQALGRPDEAMACYRRALALAPDDVPTHRNFAIALLLQGDLPAGSAEYEWRWREPDFAAMVPPDCPRWDGAPIPNGTILLRAEQGFGDAIQFVRYAPLVRACCGRVVLQSAPPLKSLLATAPGIDAIVTSVEIPADVTAYVPLLSLMHVFGTSLPAVPAAVPYLTADPQRVRRFAPPIAAAPGLKVGLVWAGNPAHANNARRSLALRELAPLLAVEGVTFFSLQKGEAAAETAAGPAERIVDLGPDLADFADTAAAITCLDLVITVDTAVAHLAGALAKPVWTLIPFAPDWRWLLDRDDSPWYPTMRLYRQPGRGDWASVIARVAEALRRAASGDAASPLPAGAAARRPDGATVVFNWAASSYFGWGVYGLNLMLHWGRRADLAICSPYPIEPRDLALDPLEMRAIDRAIADSRDFRAALAGASGEVRVPCAVLDALGNNLVGPRHPFTLIGAPSIGIVFLEHTDLDAAAGERARRYQLLVTGSNWNREVLASAGIAHTETVLQGVDTSRFRPSEKRGLFPGRFVVFAGGKLEWRKGQDIVVQAFRAFAQRHREALLLVAWNSPWPQLARSLEQNPAVAPLPFRADGQVDIPAWLAANGIAGSQVINLGPVPNADMPRVLCEADVALFPNRAEGGTNLVAMECMACGIPTILSANTGHRDLIGDDNCFPLERQRPLAGRQCQGWGDSDIDEIVATLEAVFDDRALARRRGRRGAATLRQMSWARQLDSLAELIRPYANSAAGEAASR